MSLVRLFLYAGLALLASCSILTDNDLLSASDAQQLRLTSISIRTKGGQSVASGVSATPSTIKLNWPNVASVPRIQFKSGVTTNITIEVNYQNGKPTSCLVYDASSTSPKETYSFTYVQGNLKYFNTNIAGQFETKDTLYYDENGGLQRITRSSTDAVRKGVFKISDNIAGIQAGSCDFRFFFSFQNQQYEACDPELLNIYDQTGKFKHGLKLYTLGNELLDEIKVSENANNTFYFHPILFLQFGYKFIYLYSPDWWAPSTVLHPDDLAFNLKMNYER